MPADDFRKESDRAVTRAGAMLAERYPELVVAELRRVSWPDAEAVKVGFDSADRVAAGGGWNYFR